MPEEMNGIDAVEPAMREPVRRYLQRIKEHSGDKALSLTLFGAIAVGSFDPLRQAVSNVLVLAEVDLQTLRNLAAEGHKFGKSAIAAPLVMTPAFIKASLDSFPLELIEIQQRRIVLFGDDFFESLHFENDHVRLQCERELKTIAIGIRQGLVASSGKEKSLGPVAEQAGASLARILRGLLWLEGVKEPKTSADIMAETERLLGRSLAGIRRTANLPMAYSWHDLQELYQDVEALGRFADAW